ISTGAFLLGSLLSAVANGTPLITTRDRLEPLPNNASGLEKMYQPVMDFDTDGCYAAAAISPSGSINGGQLAGARPESDCRHNGALFQSNVYSRARCNNGWCAIMYEYYFEKDQMMLGSLLGGHRHDWENTVVFVDMKENKVKRVSPSCHDKYEKPTHSPQMFNSHPKVVYHKHEGRTHCIRNANVDDDKNIENHTKGWFQGKLVGWEGWPHQWMRDTVTNGWTWSRDGGIRPKFGDRDFADRLAKAAGDGVPGFDPNVDG
ncbi:necrosis inducing protein, partial [Podospora fimiseda]